MIGADEAIPFLALIVGWNGGQMPVYLDGSLAPSTWLKGGVVELGAELARRSARWDFAASAQVEVGLPQGRRGGIAKCTVLWAWVESHDQVHRAAKRFRPAPTMVVRMGSSCRRLLIWALSEAAAHVSVLAANKRIAYALHAPQKRADPELLRIPVPGTFLRVARVRPAPVVCTLLDQDRVFTLQQVAGRLKAPPAPYLERLRAGEVKR